ncbi:hypothetical protein EGW08_014554 [Elysia chlorotica]|uniref:Uncharacterized protein n=1 Tax=Elysia chlorotica TaxID=188477 RepID=A0A433T7X5_ELYCH|nr:hypothetical protein EGW08_014554 [Elysia chlorotica]
MVLTSLPLLKRIRKKCGLKCKSICCMKNTRTESSSADNYGTISETTTISRAASAAAIATTATTSETRTVSTSTSCPDLTTVEIPRPPAYSELFNSWFETLVARSRSVNPSPGGGSASNPGVSDSNPASQRAASRPRAIFTVVVNPVPAAPMPESSGDTGNPQSPLGPPPRYEEIVLDLISQPGRYVEYPDLPPPPYDASFAEAGGPSVSGGSPRTVIVVNDMRTESGSAIARPPAQSDA